MPRQPQQRHRRVGAAAAEPGLRRDALAQTDDRRRAASRRAGARPSATAATPPSRSRLRRSVGTSGSSHSIANGPLRRRERQHVVQRQRLKDGAQIVIAVGPHAEDAQVEVDLGERGKNRATAKRHRARSDPARSPRSGATARRVVERDRRSASGLATVDDERLLVDAGVDLELLERRRDVDGARIGSRADPALRMRTVRGQAVLMIGVVDAPRAVVGGDDDGDRR